MQRSHCDHHQAFYYAEVEDSPFCASDGAEVTVLACAEVFLVAGNCGELAGELEDRLFQGGGLFGRSALLGRQACALLVLDLEGYTVSGWFAGNSLHMAN